MSGKAFVDPTAPHAPLTGVGRDMELVLVEAQSNVGPG